MKRMAVVVSAMVILAGIGMAGADEAKVAPKAPDAAAVKTQTTCPVMGNEINKKLFVDYEGKRIYVCCPMCIPTIKKDPAKYVKQLEDQGITLDKTPAEDTTKKATEAGTSGMQGGCGGGCKCK